jgi:hypothetical protein
MHSNITVIQYQINCFVISLDCTSGINNINDSISSLQD